MKHFTLSLFIIIAKCIFCQTIENHTISIGYASKKVSNVNLTSSIGEAVGDNLNNSNFNLTQGFLQIESKEEENTSYLINSNREIVLTLFPNPSSEYINVKFNKKIYENIVVQIVNTEGRKMISKEFKNTDNLKLILEV